MKNQGGFVVFGLVAALACASIYAVGYYMCNSDHEDVCAPIEQIDIVIEKVNFIEPEDKFLFV